MDSSVDRSLAASLVQVSPPTTIAPSIVAAACCATEPFCLAVMYHYVRDRDPALFGGVVGLSAAAFAAQLDELSSILEPVDWPTLYAWRQGRGTMPSRSFLVTFDDGLIDHVEIVMPLLEQRALRGVFFVPGAILAEHHLLAAHAIHLLLSNLGEEAFGRAVYDAWHYHDPAAARQAQRHLAAARAMYPYETPLRAGLKHLLHMVLPIDIRNALLEELFERHVGSARRWARDWYLHWDHVRELDARGHTIGGHGFVHEPYARLTHDQRREDARAVAAILREGLGPDIRPFSFPYGSFDQDACAACSAAGFAHAFTTEARPIECKDGLGCLPRVDTIHVHAFVENAAPCPQH